MFNALTRFSIFHNMSMNLPLINNYITIINNGNVTKTKNVVLLVCKTHIL
jgi:hypothetical protein